MPDASSPPDLVERLRRVAEQDHICTGSTDCEHCTGDCLCSYFSPEQVARGLEAALVEALRGLPQEQRRTVLTLVG